MTREHNGRAGKEACLPRAIPRGVQADAGAQCPPLSCGVRPGRDGFLRRRPSGEARLRCRVPRRYPAAAAPVRGSRPPFPGRYPAAVRAATEVGVWCFDLSVLILGLL